MTRTRILLLALLLVLLSLFFLRPLHDLPQPDPGLDSPVSTTPPSAKKDKPLSAPQRKQALERPQKEQDPGILAALTRIRGRVLWKDQRKPIARLPIQAMAKDPSSAFFRWEPKAGGRGATFKPASTAVTDKDGRFLLTRLDPQQHYFLLLGRGTEGRSVRTVDQDLEPGGSFDLGDILLEPRGNLRGTVRDENNRAIPSAEVIALDLPLSKLDCGIEHWDPLGFIVQTPALPTFVFPLNPSMRDLISKLPFPRTRTGPDGSFVLRGLPPGENTLLILHPGHRALRRILQIEGREDRDLGVLPMDRGNELEGLVLDRKGRPLPGIEVGVAPKTASHAGFARRSKQTDKEGRFRFSALGEGRHYVLVHLPGGPGMPWTAHGPFRSSPPDHPKFVRVTLKKGATLQVRVRSAKGQPIPDTKIQIQAQPTDRFLRSSILGALWKKPAMLKRGRGRKLIPDSHSNALKVRPNPKTATWSFEELPWGRYRISAQHPSFSPSSKIVDFSARTKEKTVEITLYPSTKLHILVENRGGEPVSAAEIFLLDPETQDLFLLGKSDRRGRFVLPHVPKKKIQLFARHPAYAVGTSKPFVPAPQTSLTLALPRLGSARGELTLSGEPYTGPPLGIREFGGGDSPYDRLRGSPKAITDRKGRFFFPRLNPGSYEFIVFTPERDRTTPGQLVLPASGFRPYFPAICSVTIQEGKTSQIRWNLNRMRDYFRKRKGRITGKVLTHGVKGMKLTVNLSAGTFSVMKTPDANGEFSFNHLPSQTSHVSLYLKEGYKSTELLSQSFYLKAGKPKRIVFDLSFGILEGVILDPWGNPLDHQALYLYMMSPQGNQSSLHIFTDAQGRFRTKLLQGPWTVLLNTTNSEKLGFALPPRVSRVKANQTTKVRLRARLPKLVQGTVLLDISRVHPDWRKDLENIIEPYIVFQGLRSRSFWSVPLAKNGQPTQVPPQKRFLGPYRVYSYCPQGFWTTLLTLTDENRRNFQVLLPPPKILTLPKKRSGNKK